VTVENVTDMTMEDVMDLVEIGLTLPDDKKPAHFEKVAALRKQILRNTGKTNFLDFIQHVYPGYKVGPHHHKLARIFEDIEAGKKRRVIVNIAPRHGKSEMISYLAPAWFLGKNPHKKVIMASHTADLAVNFGRRVRNLVGNERYHDIFPKSNFRPIASLRLAGVRILMVSTSLLALAALLLAVVPISLLLTTLILNRTLSRVEQKYSSQHGSGSSQDLSSD
jgi:hypothetical protein